jgi:hypothetical protein
MGIQTRITLHRLEEQESYYRREHKGRIEVDEALTSLQEDGILADEGHISIEWAIAFTNSEIEQEIYWHDFEECSLISQTTYVDRT